MTEEDCLIAAVLADPANDLPRLVYADWLEEHGRPERAEFIRVQCRIAELIAQGAHEGESCNVTGQCSECHREADVRALRDREGELMPDYPLPNPFAQMYHRGFVEEVACPAEAWLLYGDAILKVHPVRLVRLTTMPESHWCWNTVSGVPTGENVKAALSRCYPGVEFELPKMTMDVPLTPEEEVVYGGTGFVPRFGRGLPPRRT